MSDFLGRATHALALPSFDHWPPSLGSPGHFVLFVAADARLASNAAILDAARRAIASGCCSLVAWGPDCDRVHDLFDRVIVDEHVQGSETEANVIMTTWHTRDTLDEALRYFLVAATPARDYEPTCRTWVAVVIGSDEWSARVVNALGEPEQLMAPWVTVSDGDDDDE